MQDLTVVYYTANVIPDKFARLTKSYLESAIGSLPMVEIRQSPDIPRSHLQIYKNALEGARLAKTKYIALAEDDILYHSDHFKYRPKTNVFAYNMSVWSIYTWIKPPIFSYKDRRNLSQLICERDLFIEAMEERFAKYPDETKIDIGIWAEPGKYEDHLRVTRRESEKFYTNIPNIAFSHETALSYLNLGTRKRLGSLRVTALPFWGSADDILNLYV